ncbi:oxidoreductase [Xanthomonas arboricola]|uniref:oxidoreductase n=1 Tax=Xanthomonas arboricola TaxID=56448 RepID=UPI002018FE13|nr:oxidoreductase [Xanthomonas arboricola]MDN0209269.1 oxidoreductase [Xanthomonas arboricola pv. corylina]MDN0213646.1 oxidoreductase [Xanthomonas arboricola pv. corylina]UQQ12696.1 oxidoreductase [Xanthomonas arboricola pv. corylina]
MTNISSFDSFLLGDRLVRRLGYGALQLAGPNAFGPPKDRAEAILLLQEAVERGVNHIDTSDYYGPQLTNQIIREALHPYDDVLVATKVGATRGAEGSWDKASSRDDLTSAVHDNLRNLGLDVLELVNMRAMSDVFGPAEGSLEEPLTVLAELQRQGLIKHIGLSNVTATQVAEARKIVDIVCVQNMYNVAHRDDDALIDQLAALGTAYVPFFPLGRMSPVQLAVVSSVAKRLEATSMQVALAWLLQRSPNILLIPGTSSRGHLRENLAAAGVRLSPDDLVDLDQVAEPYA